MFIPIGHDKGKKRIAWVTYTIIFVNIICFFVFKPDLSELFTTPKENEILHGKYVEVRDNELEDFDLDYRNEAIRSLDRVFIRYSFSMASAREDAEEAMEEEEFNPFDLSNLDPKPDEYGDNNDGYGHIEYNYDDNGYGYDESPPSSAERAWEMFTEQPAFSEGFPEEQYNRIESAIARKIERAHYDLIAPRTTFGKYGLTPGSIKWYNFITSLFMHAGYLHLIGNMLFLAVGGPLVEDVWGRVWFPVLYFLSGIAAGLLHIVFNLGSLTPLVGASGAISGVTAAFLIYGYDARIKFLMYDLATQSWVVEIPAYAIVPLLPIRDLFNALLVTLFDIEAGTAFWAHVGGFGFALGVCFVLKKTGLEHKLFPVIDVDDYGDRQEVRKVTRPYRRHPATVSARKHVDEGEWDQAIEQFQLARQAFPNEPEIPVELAEAYLWKEEQKTASALIREAVILYAREQSIENAYEQYERLRSDWPQSPEPPGGTLLSMGRHLEKLDQPAEALSVYRTVFDLADNDLDGLNAMVRSGDISLKSYDQPINAEIYYHWAEDLCGLHDEHWKEVIEEKIKEAREPKPEEKEKN